MIVGGFGGHVSARCDFCGFDVVRLSMQTDGKRISNGYLTDNLAHGCGINASNAYSNIIQFGATDGCFVKGCDDFL